MNTIESGVVVISDWSAAYDSASIGGSVYAVPPALRVAAATALHAAGNWVHADVIITAAGVHRGVTPAELFDIQKALPEARLDVHVMLSPATVLEEVALEAARAAVGTALSGGARRLSLSPTLLKALAPEIAECRLRNIEIWCEIARGEAATDHTQCNGYLVMLIPPGTKENADLDALSAINDLWPGLPIGVDGGVDARVIEACRVAGVTYFVSGRALLHAPPQQFSTKKEDKDVDT